MRQRRELPADLIVLATLLPHGPDDVDHFPVRHPLAACTRLLLALTTGHRTLHRRLDTLRGADRNIRLHSTLPQRVPAILVGGVHGAADAVLVVPHVAVGHGDRV